MANIFSDGYVLKYIVTEMMNVKNFFESSSYIMNNRLDVKHCLSTAGSKKIDVVSV